VTAHGGKRHKADSTEAIDAEAEKATKAQAVAAKEKADVEAVPKVKADAEATSKEKAARDAKAKAKAKKFAKAAAAAGTPKWDAKDLALTQSPAVAEVVNVENAGTITTIGGSAMYAVPSGDFEELHRQLGIVHQVCLFSFSAHVYIAVSPRGSSRSVRTT
jgi:membrane protein involved in colicin uptake